MKLETAITTYTESCFALGLKQERNPSSGPPSLRGGLILTCASLDETANKANMLLEGALANGNAQR